MDDEINLLDLLIVLAKHKKRVLGLPFAAAVVAAAISLIMPNIYTAKTTLMPPQQNQSTAAALLGQLAGPAAPLAGSAALGIKNPSDIFVSILKSRTVTDDLVKRFDLQKVYHAKLLTDARRDLDTASNISSSFKDGIITVEVDDRDPKRAADIANAYVEELEKLSRTLAVGEASQRRLFFGEQLKGTKAELIKADTDLKKFQESTGLVLPQGQAAVTISASANLRAQITAKEVQLAAMRTFATGQNPELVRTQEELAGLKSQLAKLEGQSAEPQGDVLVAIGKMPAASLEYLNKARDVKYYETLYNLLAQQYELAKLDEARNATLIQVIDKAVPPERKSKPRRARIVILTALLVGFVAVLWAFMKEAAERAKAVPEQAEKLQLLRRYLWGR